MQGGDNGSARLFGSDALVETLRELGAEYVFLNPESSFPGIHDRWSIIWGTATPRSLSSPAK